MILTPESVRAQAKRLTHRPSCEVFVQGTCDCGANRVRDMLDTLAALLERRCETCVFHGTVDHDRYFSACEGREQLIGGQNCHRFGWVPLAAESGEPFSCPCWARKDGV